MKFSLHAFEKIVVRSGDALESQAGTLEATLVWVEPQRHFLERGLYLQRGCPGLELWCGKQTEGVGFYRLNVVKRQFCAKQAHCHKQVTKAKAIQPLTILATSVCA